MRVYLNIPHGVAVCVGQHIHGYADGYEPLTVKYKDYIANKNALAEAPYTPGYLSKLFGKEFPYQIRFTLEELKYIEFNMLRDIATWLGRGGIGKKDNFMSRIRYTLQDL